jgi:hypothetical protein
MKVNSQNSCLAVLALVVVVSLSACGDPDRKEAAAMYKRAKQMYEPHDLQEAVVQLYERYKTNSDVPVAELPLAVLSLHPAPPSGAHVIPESQEKEWRLTVLWGSGFGHAGVIVCIPGKALDRKSEKDAIFWGDGVAFVYEQ